MYCVSWYQFIVFQYLPRFSKSWAILMGLITHRVWSERPHGLKTKGPYSHETMVILTMVPSTTFVKKFQPRNPRNKKNFDKHWWIKTCFDVFVQYSFLLIQGRRNEGTTWNMDERGSRWPATWSPSCWSCPRPKHRPARALGNLGTCEGKKEKGYSKVQYTSIYIIVATETLLFWGKHLWTKPVTLELMCGWAHRATRANTFKQHNAKCKLLLSRMTLEKKSRDYRPGHHLREFSLGVAKFNFIVFREKKWCLTHPRYWNMYRFVWKWGKYLKSYGLLWWFPLGHHLPTNCNKDHGKES